MSLRLRRLQADYERLQTRCAKSPYIRIRSTKGDPPERYEIVYSVKGLRLDSKSQIIEATDHAVEIALTSGYPRQAPQCRMLTSIFHPNIDLAAVCIGDHWAAAEALDDLVVRIAEMITYQSYNTKSPLDGEAARWADQNQHLLPIDPTDLWPAEQKPRGVASAQPQSANKSQCANCGAHGTGAKLAVDAQGRWICHDCVGECRACGAHVVVGESLCAACQTKAVAYIERARKAMAQRDAKEAGAIVDAGMREFPNYRPLSAEKNAVGEALAKSQHVTEQLKAAMKAHGYVHACQLIAELKTLPVQIADLDRAAEVSEARRAKATSLFERAQLELLADAALGAALLRRAKQLCEDHSGVSAALDRLESQKRRIPGVEGQLLAALEKGNATEARDRLLELDQLADLSREARAQLEDQILVLENSRATTRRIVIGAAISSVVVIIVAAVMLALR